jgi:hypothetical protein
LLDRHVEPPRVCRRLQLLRRRSHEHVSAGAIIPQ